MTELVLLRPWWLLALPAAVLLALWVRRRGPAAGGWERVMPPAMLAAMASLGHLGGGGRAGLGAVAAIGLIGLGLSGPAVPRADAPLLADSGAILIALDLSPSVAEGPAMADAKAAAAAVLAAAAGRPVGLILYAGEAYEVAAPTADPAVLESDIAVLGPGVMPGAGSRPASALALAREMLGDLEEADLVLISDGGGFDAATAAEAERLVAAGIRIDLLTLDGRAGGGSDFGNLPDLADAVAPARAPDPVLDRLAATGGIGNDAALTALRFRDLGPFVAGFAMIPLLALFRRRT
jgi:Ca-activated chloride channel family protein